MTKNKTITWKTEQRKVVDLIPYDKNPRTLSTQQQKDLEASLMKFGLAEIPAINRDNTLIAGHQRIKVLLALGKGEEKIDVRVPNRKLNKKEFEEYLLRSNRNTGSWSLDLLRTFDTEFLLEIGFDDTDLSDIWDDVLEIEDDEFDEEKEAEKAQKTKIKDGDMFKLGEHVLACGDSTNIDVITNLVGKNKIDILYQDSPYNINYSYDKGQSKKSKYGANVIDDRSDEEFYEFVKTITQNVLAVGNKDMHIFSYADQRYVGLWQRLYAELGIEYKRTALWLKNGFNPTPQVAFNKSYEPCIYGVIGKPYLSDNKKLSEIMNREIGVGNATLDDIFDYLDIWLAKRDPGNEYNHSTQKPLTLHEKPLRRCSKIGDKVLDPFGGSGSTLLACEQLKRQAFLVEKEPVFCQVIINRFEKLTGKHAKQIN